MFHRHGCGSRRERFQRDERGGPWWGEGGGRQFRGGGGPRRGRVFDHGALRLIVLQLLAEKPSHGYELIKEIQERLGGAYAPSPGVVYPTLTMLEDLGYAAPTEAEGNRKLYAITAQGQVWLDENAEELARIKVRMGEVKASVAGAPAPQIVRAVENLRMALRLRLGRPLSEDRIRAIAAALDAAAQEVERE